MLVAFCSVAAPRPFAVCLLWPNGYGRLVIDVFRLLVCFLFLSGFLFAGGLLSVH